MLHIHVYNIPHFNVLFVAIYQLWYHVVFIEHALYFRLFANDLKAWVILSPPANLKQKKTLE